PKYRTLGEPCADSNAVQHHEELACREFHQRLGWTPFTRYDHHSRWPDSRGFGELQRWSVLSWNRDQLLHPRCIPVRRTLPARWEPTEGRRSKQAAGHTVAGGFLRLCLPITAILVAGRAPGRCLYGDLQQLCDLGPGVEQFLGHGQFLERSRVPGSER